jgi:hypothetical protein
MGELPSIKVMIGFLLVAAVHADASYLVIVVKLSVTAFYRGASRLHVGFFTPL